MPTIDDETRLTYPFFTEELRDKVIAIVRADLDTAPFQDQFVFDPIVVEPNYDLDGEDSLRIFIVSDGDFGLLDPRWTGRLVTRIRPKLIAQGLPHFGVLKSFVEKSEWEERHLYLEEEWAEPAPGIGL